MSQPTTLYGLSIHFASDHHIELLTSDPDVRTALRPTLSERPNDRVVELVEFTMEALDDPDGPVHTDEGDICDCAACRVRRLQRYH